MTRLHNPIPVGEVLHSIVATAASTERPTVASTSRRQFEAPTAIRPEPPALRRHPHAVQYPDIEADFDALIDKAIAAIADGEPVEDEILGHYVNVASMVRAVSFREGKLLEQAAVRLSKANPDLVVLMQSIKLPLVKAAIEAVAGNDWRHLEGVRLDCEAPARGSYTPDLIVINRAKHSAVILDLKRSLASYGDTSRLEELKLKMMTAAMILPDWLYKTQKRMMVDTVGVAIVDGASRPSDHTAGVWALSEVDDLLEIDGAAACMAELRQRFGQHVQQLLEAEARRALGLVQPPTTAPAVASGSSVLRSSLLRSRLRVMACSEPEDDVFDANGFDSFDDEADEPAADEDDEMSWPPKRIRVGFARRLLDA